MKGLIYHDEKNKRKEDASLWIYSAINNSNIFT